MKRRRFASGLLVLVFAVTCGAQDARGLSSLFTYQGRLDDAGVPVDQSCDFQVRVFDAWTAGSPIGALYTFNGVTVSHGLFVLDLDFGTSVFTGDDRWLELAVRCPAGSGDFQSLGPRQQLTATPYALYAAQAGSAGNLTCNGCVGSTALGPDSVTSTAIGNGTIQMSNLAFTPGSVTSITADDGLLGGTITTSGVIGVNFGTAPSTVAEGDHGHAGTYWDLGGNAGTTPGTQYLGTSDNQALELAVNGARALRLEPTTPSPNLIGGSQFNGHDGGVVGATVGGGGAEGLANTVHANYGTIGGGQDNDAGEDAAVGGGLHNNAASYASTVAGGFGNGASANFATVGGGDNNSASGLSSTIAGGSGGDATGQAATIGGGSTNSAGGNYSTVGGGQDNVADVAYATIGGGGRTEESNADSANQVTDDFGTIGGGGGNRAGNSTGTNTDAVGATVGGGGANTAGGPHATVGGGFLNLATGPQSAICGGTVNLASGQVSAIPGGTLNSAEAFGSFAAGVNAHSLHTGSFVWSDGTRNFPSTTAQQFAALATGGFRFYYDVTGNYCELTSGTGWSCVSVSDRDAKADLEGVDEREVLERLVTLPILAWRYKGDQNGTRHIGPMAQDFHAAFQVGEDDKHIGTVDADGVALAAIQGLYELVREQGEALSALRESNNQLEASLAVFEEKASSQLRADVHHLQ